MKIYAFVLAITCAALSFAGVTWKGTMVSKNDGKETVTVMNAFAQKGNVREEFAEVRGTSPVEKGDYIIYRSDKNVMYIVDVKEKSYMEMSIDALGSMGGMMEIKITNPKVSAKAGGAETVSGFKCQKVIITSSYDMEMKVMFMTTKSHVEQTQEIWTTKDVALAEFGEGFRTKGFKTGMKDLDKLIVKEMQAMNNGFPVKTVMTQKSTSDGKTSVNTSEMTVTSVATKALAADLFTVPADYKKSSLDMSGASSGAPKQETSKAGASSTTKSKAKTDEDDESKAAEKAAKEMMKNLFK